jgi:NitT/TauT family transport system substrate-binding protein
MKIFKAMIVLLVSVLVLIGCQTQTTREINILVPTGAPSILFVDLMSDDINTVDIVNGVDPIMSEFLNPNASYDVIVAPIVSVTKLQMENKTSYKLLGIASWGNLVILGKEGVDLNSSSLAIFAPMGIPGVISKYLLEKEGLNPTIQAVPTMADAMSLYLGGHVEAVLMAYPLAADMIDKHDLSILMDIQNVYEKHSGLSNYPQAGIYVSESFFQSNKSKASSIMNQLQSTHLTNVSATDRLGKLSDDIKSKLMIENMTPLMNNYNLLGLQPCYALEKLNDLNAFLNLFELQLQSNMIVR